MRVGVIVDGQAEFKAIGTIVQRSACTHIEVCKVLYADLQPRAQPRKLARAARSRMKILAEGYAVDLIVVLLDAEDRTRCSPDIVRHFTPALREELDAISHNTDLELVVKTITFENWLAADPDGLRAMPRRFPGWERIRNAVSQDRADSANALELLRRNVDPKTAFHKVLDARRIAEHLVPERAARNSRSFRRFLRVIGHQNYTVQSRNPGPQ